jgi:hypothetical protein
MADTVEAPTPQQQGNAEQAREKAQEVAGQAGSRLREQVDQRSTQLGERVNSTSTDLRNVGQELRKQGKDAPARMADQAADRVGRVGGYLAESDTDRILRDIEDFGRRRPIAVLAGGLMLGVAAARFLKASSSRRYQERPSAANGHRLVPQQTAAGWQDVRPATPDAGEHHQRFEGHS